MNSLSRDFIYFRSCDDIINIGQVSQNGEFFFPRPIVKNLNYFPISQRNLTCHK